MRFTPSRVGVLLAGCGTHDGSDVAEALFVLLELERRGVQPVPLCPAGDQMHVVDHSTGEEMPESRRQMAAEAARITRGQIEILGERTCARLHGLIVPGGGGAAKNLMSGFLERGVRRRPIPQVATLLEHMLHAGKPIGTTSVANFLLQGLVPDSPVLPERAGTEPEPLVVDPERRLVYAPGFLSACSLPEVAETLAALVEMVLHYAAEARSATGGTP